MSLTTTTTTSPTVSLLAPPPKFITTVLVFQFVVVATSVFVLFQRTWEKTCREGEGSGGTQGVDVAGAQRVLSLHVVLLIAALLVLYTYRRRARTNVLWTVLLACVVGAWGSIVAGCFVHVHRGDDGDGARSA